MAAETGIAWTDATVNFVLGCTPCGPGCDACYAKTFVERKWPNIKFEAGGHRHVTTSGFTDPLKWQRMHDAGKTTMRVDGADIPLPVWIFACSLSDFFDNEWPDGVRDRAWEVIRQCPALRWILVTKRVGNVQKMLPADWDGGRNYRNVGVVATMVNQEEIDRDMPKLAALKSLGVRWCGLSIEPQLDRIDLSKWIGGENAIEEHRGKSLSGGADRRIGNRFDGSDLAIGREAMGSLERWDQDDSMQETASGETNGGLFANPTDGKWQALERTGPSAGLSAFQGADTGGNDDQPWERQETSESTLELGNGNILGTANSCDPRSEARARTASERSQESDGEIDSGGRPPDQTATEKARIAESDCQGLSGNNAGHFENCSRRPLDILSWVICGGESKQEGIPARPFHLEWATSIVKQCEDASVPCFVKQMGDSPFLRGQLIKFKGKGDNIQAFPRHLRVQQMPQVFADDPPYAPRNVSAPALPLTTPADPQGSLF